jgi:hypothetical protein
MTGSKGHVLDPVVPKTAVITLHFAHRLRTHFASTRPATFGTVLRVVFCVDHACFMHPARFGRAFLALFPRGIPNFLVPCDSDRHIYISSGWRATAGLGDRPRRLWVCNINSTRWDIVPNSKYGMEANASMLSFPTSLSSLMCSG